MIPFASQRGLGQDLAAHLQNELDNERMEVAELRGSIAQDLHGAFAEWEVQAKALTRCRNYLYSLSVNPDPAQGPLSRDQYHDYIARAEDKLGLAGQPRAIVFHTKHGREHCHVVWSRIDVENEKAVQMAFDHEKLMMVTREFARDHGLELPAGYHKDKGQARSEQLSLYEQHQQRSTGISKEQRIAQVTKAWQASDSPQAFIQALASDGYILATGKRPYVLIDLYGEMNALPKLIADKQVRTKDVRAFLEKDYPPESLPSVEEARKLAKKHLQISENFAADEQRRLALADLKKAQALRRQKVEEQQRVLENRQQKEITALGVSHSDEKTRYEAAYRAKVEKVKRSRAEKAPTGLAAFLGRYSGVLAIQKVIHRYQDHKRYQEFVKGRDALVDQQARERKELARRHAMQRLDLERQARALKAIERRERKSLDEKLLTEVRSKTRGETGRAAAPKSDLEKKAPKVKARPQSQFARDLAAAVSDEKSVRAAKLKDEFEKSASDGKAEDEGHGSTDGKAPKVRFEQKPQGLDVENEHDEPEERLSRRRKRDRDPGRER